jgi:hypothetical protein
MEPLGNIERVVAKKALGSGHQYQVKHVGSDALAWIAASRVKAQFPALVAAFEQGNAGNGGQANEGDVSSGQPPQLDAAALALQVAALQKSLLDQQDLLAAALKTTGGSSGSSSSLSAPSTSRFARKEPRTQDLREYEGASGIKLDEWIDDLDACVALFHLNDAEAVEFAVSRLRGPARQWWNALGAAPRPTTAAALGAALRSRFQPITSERVAREQLRSLRQGGRGINEYIAEFQRLHAMLPDMSAKDALFSFESGVAGGLALELRKAGTTSLSDAIALAARIGGLTAAGSSSSSSPPTRSSAHQMEVDSGDGSFEDRVARVVLNVMQSQGSGAPGALTGLGAKTQTQRGYAQARSGRGGGQGFRGGRSGGRNVGEAPQLPSVPGVSPEVVAQRRAANQCYRCGDASHTRFECMNASKPLN